jgi:hypothetical protein
VNAGEVLAALALPSAAIINQRVPKSLLSDNGAPAASDKRLIKDGVDRLQWIAALKPGTVGVPEFRGSDRDYLEIAVVELTLRPAAKTARLIEVTHRAIPYPVVLIVERDNNVSLSLAHKRASRAEQETTVLDGDVITVSLDEAARTGYFDSFSASLALSRQPRTSLYDLYQGWIDDVLALEAARITGTLEPPRNADHAARRRDALQECSEFESKIAALRSTAAKTKQIPRRATINIELARLRAAQAAAHAKL